MTSDKQPYSWSLDHLYNMETSAGKGLFAGEKIKKGDLVIIFGGYVMSHEEERGLGEGMTDFAHMIHEDFVFGVRDRSRITKTDYVNHSCNPSCGFSGEITFVALRDIEVGEEITFDYATVIMRTLNNKYIYNFKCECGGPSCRGYVTQDDWSIRELQEKYKGYFQPYIQKVIDSSLS
jgi:SET domain-containing protein